MATKSIIINKLIESIEVLKSQKSKTEFHPLKGKSEDRIDRNILTRFNLVDLYQQQQHLLQPSPH